MAIRSSVLTYEKGLFGYNITCYADTTRIEYWERVDDNTGKTEIKSTISLTVGYDLEVFEEAIRLRKLAKSLNESE